MYVRIAALLLLITLASCSSSWFTAVGIGTSPTGELRGELNAAFDDPNFYNAHWGVLIQSLSTGEVLVSRNEYKSFMPASNMKLFTSSAALATLGPNFTYTTRLLTDGIISGDTLNGSLILSGSGDPTISGRFNGGRVTQTFEQWADSLLAMGIRVVNGDIIGDDNCFDDDYYGSAWSADYETDWYAAQVGGIVFNDNCVDFSVSPADSFGIPADIMIVPDTKYVTIINETVTVPPESTYYISFERKRGTNIIYVRGKFPTNKSSWNESIAVDNPTLYAVTVLKEVLASKGIAVSGNPVDIDNMPADTSAHPLRFQVASYVSPSLSEIVKTINKPSQNLYAEQVFRTMGRIYYGTGGMKTGRYAAYPVFARWGIDTTRLMMLDGSGLSRMDLVTPRDIVSVLAGMQKSPVFSTFYDSLPIAGVDGSLRSRLKDTKAQNNVRAKTGFIGYVRSLSGYVTSADGELFVFSIVANHYTVPTSMVEKIQDYVCVRLANFSRKR